jgi:hypothetical protein
MFKPLFLFPAFGLALMASAVLVFAQDDDIDAQMKKAMQDMNKPAANKADMKKLQKQAMDQINQAEAEDKAEEAKKKAEVQPLVDQKGPASLPDWTPPVPQFTPAGPAQRKAVEGEARIVVTGTSPLSPDALCDAWDKFSNPKFSHERTGSDINHNVDLFVTYRKVDDNSEVKMEAERKAGAKITHVTLSSPIRNPAALSNGE